MTASTWSHTIAVIDDTPANLGVLTRLLEGAGFSVRVFLRGAVALEAMKIEQPDLVLLDIAMPDMDGFEVCARLKEDGQLADIPVIFISARVDAADKLRGFQAGGVDYVTKPFQQEEVLARVSVHLELRRAKLELERHYAELQQAHAELGAAQSRLVESEKLASVGMLAAGVAHEINNPLNFMSSSAITVKRKAGELMAHIGACGRVHTSGPPGTEQPSTRSPHSDSCHDAARGLTELTENIVEGARRAAEIVEGLRLFSRVDRGAPEIVDLLGGLDSTIKLLVHRAGSSVQIEKDFQPLPRTFCYPSKLNQIYMNLLLNAVDSLELAGRSQGRIVVRTRCEAREDGQWIAISVVDDGPGFPIEVIPRVFEPFFTTKPVGHGAGLGLSISHGIAQDHGGSLVAENEPNGGGRVTLNLPVRDQPYGKGEDA